MNNNYLPFASGSSIGLSIRRFLTFLFLCQFSFAPLLAEGTQDVAPNPDDLVMLLIGDADFGSFASPAASEASRLYVRMNSPEETLYIGLSREFTDDGSPASTGSYTFRIKRAEDGQVVHGPFSVNAFVENVSTWEDVVAGPDALNGGVGYPTDDDRYVFQPEEAGLYYVEFVSADYIGLWDFTVAADGAEVPGRVYSKNWAFRTPTVNNEQPECVWDRRFNGALYSYTTDGFVTRIDFANSGFQGLSFTMAFNTSGPGQSGDLAADRMSIPGESPDDSFAEHLVFLSEPDPELYPNGECGSVNVAPFFTCTGPGTYCLEVDVTSPGQVEVVIDANQNNVYDEGIDRRILYAFEPGESLSACLDWDGLLGDGSPIPPGSNVNLLVQYTQGVQHWTVYDGEFLKDGFCVEPIRPICPETAGSTDILYWDDRNIPEDPGTGQPKDGRAGCECESIGCRTWNNFDPQTEDCSDISDDQTTGYGDKNALNTWWFANITTESLAGIPLVSLSVEGEAEVCEGETTPLTYVFTSGGSITNVTWTGPSGIIAQGPDAPVTIDVSEPGTYTVEIINESGCSFTATHELTSTVCPTDLALDITASDLTPNMWQMVSFTITVTNEGPHFANDFTVNTNWPDGITNVQVVTAGGVVNGSSIDWANLSLAVGESTTFVFTGLVTPAFDYTVNAEISEMPQGDLDSTPGNGVDTNGNGQCADDPGDEDDGDCVELTVPPCSISAEITNINCFDNLTPTDPTDDSFGFSLRVISSYGAGSWTGTLNGQPISGNYGLSTSYSGYDISDGDLTLVIEDATFGSDCATTAIVEAPETCSTDCILSIETEPSVCNDEGTNFDPSDDTYSIRFRINGINDSGTWTASDGTTGEYGIWYTYDGYSIADGDVIFIFTDSSNPECNPIIQTFTAPETCSDECLLEVAVGEAVCDPNGTLSDPSDDTFTFTVDVTGWNTGSDQWQANDPNASTGAYGQVIVLGPYPISGGDLSFTISDPTNPDCSVAVNVTAPETCSDVCELTLEEGETECNDAGTNSEPGDDTFTVRVRLSGANASDGWTASNGQSGDYGEWVVLGPFLIADGDVTIEFSDNEVEGCDLTETFTAPESCSTTCLISASATDPVCDDNGTPWDPSDDTYTFFLTVEGNNTSAGWTADDPLGTAGLYETPRLMGPYAISDGGLSLTITDAGNSSCTTTVSVDAPEPCSDECLITAELVVGSEECDPNGTPTDPTDDTFTFTVVVEGFNTGNLWTASNGQSGSYGIPRVLGPFNIADGDVTVTFTDSEDSSCTTEVTVSPPATCSNDCGITVTTTEPICDDNGTPWDPTDDTYTFFLTAVGANASNGWVAEDPTNASGDYGSPVLMGPYDISDGDLAFILRDAEDAACAVAVQVEAAASCSEDCLISVELVANSVKCDDNMTPADPSDDIYTFSVIVDGFNTAGTWTASNGQSGVYGEPQVLGPFDIADGDVSLIFTDDDDNECTTELTVPAAETCSPVCEVQAAYSEVRCDDQGTPTDPSDDTYTFVMTVTGSNVSGTWEASDGSSGEYGVPAMFGPYAISDGDINLTISDSEDASCADEVSVPAPPTCSDQCAIEVVVENYQCFDNGSPFDPSDDTYTFDLTVNALNNAGPGWIQPNGNSGLYGETTTQGPFLIADGPFAFEVQDVLDEECTASANITPPPSCSDECLVIAEIVETLCDDNGTPDDFEDDEFTYSILVTGLNTGDSWVASDGNSGSYGEVVESIGGFDYSQGILELIVTDIDGGCADTVEVSAPVPALFCPEDTDQREFTANIQILRGELNEEDVLLTEEPCFLALSSTPILLGDRWEQPIFIDTLENGQVPIDSTAYNFFYFTNIPLDSELEGLGTADGIGMLFRGDYTTYDDPCCFNQSYGGSLGEDTSIMNTPLLIDTTGMFDQPMYLVQHFTQYMRVGEAYTLVSSTFGPLATGDFAWVIVSTSEEPLDVLNTDVASDFNEDQTLSEELTYFHIPWAQDEEESIDQLGYVILEPPCGVDTLYFADNLERIDNCEESIITRTFTLEYDGAPIDSCDQLITFRRPTIDDIVLPPATVTFQCGDDYSLNSNGYPDPQDTGYPLIRNGEGYDTLFAQVPFFNLGVSYKDIPNFDTTDLQLNLTREWNIVDACDGDTLYVIEQAIKIGPFGPPRLICPESTGPCSCPEENILIFGLDPFECTATVEIPLAELVGFCDESRAEDWSITTELIRNVDDQLLETIPFEGARNVSNLERGEYTLRYIAEDLDGNRVERQCPMRIEDFQQPTAICRSSITVMVSDQELTMVYPDEVNLGSYDNCGDVNLLLRRFYNEGTDDCNGELAGGFGDWTSELDLDCCDAGETFLVEMQVMDIDGNENVCNVTVTVMDDQEPVLTGLENQNLVCSEIPQDFEPMDPVQRTALFGMPIVLDNCDAEVVEMEPELSWDNCQLGSMTRKFMATDHAGNVSNGIYEQHIEVSYNNSYSIRFPQDITTDCVEGIGTVEFLGGGCGDFEVSYADVDMSPEGAECLRFERTYTIINHCAYDGVSAPVELMRDEDCDTNEGEEDLWLVVADGLAYTDADSDASNAFPPSGANTCSTNPEGYWRSLGNTGAWTYKQIIKIMDDTAPAVTYEAPVAFCSEGASCEGPVTLAVDILEQCLAERMDVRLFLDLDRDGTTDNDLTELGVLSNQDSRYDIYGYFPTGEHAFVIEASDACGNLSTERIDFAVVDCFVEQPLCVVDMQVALEPVIPAEDLDGDGIIDEGAVRLAASELADLAGLDCTGAQLFSVNRVGETINFDAQDLILTCEDRYQATREVVVRDNAFNPYAEQPDGSMGGPNYRTCTITISVQDPNDFCSSCAENDLEIEGAVRNSIDDPISGVQMDIYLNEILSGTAYTVSEGAYQFPDLEFSNTYRVRPYKNDDTAAGITTLDMIALARHLNGSAVITDPYVLLAADIDANGIVDIADFNYLGDLLLDRIGTWPNNTSWRFLPAAYELTDIGADIPDYIEYTDLSMCQFGQDFIGIKIGDINGSLTNSGMLTEDTNQRFLAPWWLQVPDYQLQAGDLYRIPVRARDLEALSGLDIALQLNTDGLRILEIEEGLLSTTDINSSLLDRGILKAIWVKQANANAADALFTLVVEAQSSQPLSELMQIAEADEALAYQDDLTPFQLQLEFVDQGQEAVLLENYPDPFGESTQIEFFLPQAGEFVLELSDARGKVLRRYRQQALAGRQQITVFGNDLPSGILFYTLTFNERQLSRRMVKL